MNSIYKFNFDFNEDILLLEYDKIKHKSENYIDRRPGGQAENWRIIPANFHYAKYLIKCFNLGEARPRFYTLPKGSNIPEHIDDQTKCSINILLETNNPAPVTNNFYSVNSIPDDIKEIYLNKLYEEGATDLINYLEHAEYNETDMWKMLRHLKRRDRLRKTNLLDVFPEWKKYYENCNG